jgi:hypothetical protein
MIIILPLKGTEVFKKRSRFFYNRQIGAFALLGAGNGYVYIPLCYRRAAALLYRAVIQCGADMLYSKLCGFGYQPIKTLVFGNADNKHYPRMRPWLLKGYFLRLKRHPPFARSCDYRGGGCAFAVEEFYAVAFTKPQNAANMMRL